MMFVSSLIFQTHYPISNAINGMHVILFNIGLQLPITDTLIQRNNAMPKNVYTIIYNYTFKMCLLLVFKNKKKR